MSPVVAKARRDPEMARIAIDSYLASSSSVVAYGEHYHRVEAAVRALDLAVLIRDNERTHNAKLSLISLQRTAAMVKEAVAIWKVFDRLIDDKRIGVTDEESTELVAELEQLVAHFSDSAKPEQFNPHATQDTAKRLIRHYTRNHRIDDVKRLNIVIAKAFEHFASLGNPMLASAVLQTAVSAYRNAGLPDESSRTRVLMEQKIEQSREQFKSIVTEQKIAKEDIDKFLAAVVADDLGTTFCRLAVEFLPKKSELEKQILEHAKIAPLHAHMPITITADNHVAAKVGSIDEDLFGRTIYEMTANFGLTDFWLHHAIERIKEVHNVLPEHIVGWANRLNLFDDVSFLLDGVRAWYEDDLVKAIHVLVPQIERGLRSIVAQLGKPVTKAHPKIAGVSVAIGMGDILYTEEIVEALGPDLTLYFLAAHADPRGWNLRNRVAHGQINPGSVNAHFVRWLIHTLLVFGVWQELAKARR